MGPVSPENVRKVVFSAEETEMAEAASKPQVMVVRPSGSRRASRRNVGCCTPHAGTDPMNPASGGLISRQDAASR
jgi:hypothetical protein